ncbi:hypothetical protein [Escherichia coli]
MILRHRTGPAFQAIKDSLAVGLNALTLTDITKNATYGVEIESLVLEIMDLPLYFQTPVIT